MALRALQGFFECNITPGFLLMTTAWYRKQEHASRSLLWQSSQGLFSVMCNLMLYGIARHVVLGGQGGSLAAWRCISLFLGALTMAGTVVCGFVLGNPREVRWLTAEEKDMAVARVVENQVGEEGETGTRWKWEQFGECFRDPQIYFQFLYTFLACVPNG